MNALRKSIVIRPFRLLVASLLIAHAAGAAAQSAADRDLEALADKFVATVSDRSPVRATELGDHLRDDVLDDVSGNARQRQLKSYRVFLAELEAIDWQQLSRSNQIDTELLRNELRFSIWRIETLQDWAWNPLVYVSLAGTSIYGLLARDFGPLPQRLNNAATRLEQLPRFLRQVRDQLQPQRVPKIHAETAIAQNPGMISIIDDMLLPLADSLSASDRQRLDAAIEIARDAIAEHQNWLEEELLPSAAGDFRIGAELFDAKLAFTLNSPLDRREIRRRAENEYVAVRNAMYDLSKDLYAERHPYASFPDGPDDAFKQVVIRSALEQAYLELPVRGGIVDMARTYLEEATAFVEEKNIVTVPDDPVEIIVMPEFRRGIALAYMDAAGALDRGQKSFYAVSPLPTDWTDEQVSSFLREYNTRSVQNLTIHEAMPGHYLQLALSNRHPSMLRAMLGSGPFIEGWAVYVEKVMADAGYLDSDPLMRLIQLKWYLRAITNAIIDQAIHVDGMSRDAAMRLMIEGGFQEEREAAGKWVRAQLTSTQLSTYFVGYQEHIDMRAAVEDAWGDEFTLRRYHDQALSYGSPAVKYVRAEMLDEKIPRRAQ